MSQFIDKTVQQAFADALAAKLKSALSAKQDTLTIDTAADASSANPVTNGAITSYVQGIFTYDSSTQTLDITV